MLFEFVSMALVSKNSSAMVVWVVGFDCKCFRDKSKKWKKGRCQKHITCDLIRLGQSAYSIGICLFMQWVFMHIIICCIWASPPAPDTTPLHLSPQSSCSPPHPLPDATHHGITSSQGGLWWEVATRLVAFCFLGCLFGAGSVATWWHALAWQLLWRPFCSTLASWQKCCRLATRFASLHILSGCESFAPRPPVAWTNIHKE